jgi:hypothetical protein
MKELLEVKEGIEGDLNTRRRLKIIHERREGV